MSKTKDGLGRDDFHATLDALVTVGWVNAWARRGDGYAIEWTAIGLERKRWIRTIDEELDPNARAMLALFAVCTQFS
ncbi:MAG: hypothetical protein WC205_16810 [Opitutaceae bacterium]|jgi:hypothetical protein